MQVLSKLQKTSIDDSKEAGGTTEEKKESTSSDTEEGEIKESSKGDNDEVTSTLSNMDINFVLLFFWPNLYNSYGMLFDVEV